MARVACELQFVNPTRTLCLVPASAENVSMTWRECCLLACVLSRAHHLDVAAPFLP